MTFLNGAISHGQQPALGVQGRGVMVESSRPRPRPKPKASAKSVVSNGNAPGGGSSTASTSKLPAASAPALDDDEDAMFMRNRHRTVKTWQMLEKKNKAAASIAVESGSEDEDNIVRSPRRHGKKRKQPSMPAWKNPEKLERLLSADIDSDIDQGDLDILEDNDTPRASRNAPTKKRICTRQRSVTPPPALSHEQLQHSRILVQQTLNIQPRAPSPVSFEDDDDDTDFVAFSNPELAAIAKNAKLRVPPQIPASSPAPDGADTVIVSVKWKPHPLNEAGREDLWMFKMNRDDNFRDLFDACAEEAQILPDDLVICYNNRQIFSSVTPIALRIWGKAELVACEKSTYEYLRKNPSAESSHFTLDKGPTPAPQGLSDEDDDDDQPFEYAEPQGGNESDADGDTFKITIRSGVTKDITVKVRPSTTCGAIVKAFLQKASLQDRYPGVFNPTASSKGTRGKPQQKDPRICIDGDKMGNDTEIGDADLEDGDLVEVVGL